MRIGSEIKKIRIEKGISQNDMAQKTGISQARISMIENDKYPDTSRESLRPILDVLGVTHAEVCDRAQTVDDKQTILYEIMDKLNQIGQIVAPGNGVVTESNAKVIDEFGNTALLPVEFSPVLTVTLRDNVGEYRPGDVLFFIKIKNPSEIKETDVLVEKTISGTPQVFLATDMKKYEQAVGRAIRVLKQL